MTVRCQRLSRLLWSHFRDDGSTIVANSRLSRSVSACHNLARMSRPVITRRLVGRGPSLYRARLPLSCSAPAGGGGGRSLVDIHSSPATSHAPARYALHSVVGGVTWYVDIEGDSDWGCLQPCDCQFVSKYLFIHSSNRNVVSNALYVLSFS